MSSAPTIAITGATGVVGGHVARELADRGVPQRLLVRTPDTARNLPAAPVFRSSYSDQDAARAALKGVDTLFMVSAHESPDRIDQHRSFVDAAVSAGVTHIVYTSFAAAAPDATFTLARDHWATEHTFEPPGSRGRSSATASTSTSWRPSSVTTESSAVPPGKGALLSSPARMSAAQRQQRFSTPPRTPAAFTTSPVRRRSPWLRSPPPSAASAARDVTFHDETIEEAYASRASYGAPDWQVDAWVTTYSAIRSNIMAPVSSSIEDITGRAPMDLETHLRSTAR